MAWIRWRGQSAQRMATVWENGKSRQRYLASFGGVYTVPTWMPQQITERYPTLAIDWAAIQAAVVAGPPGAVPPSVQMLDWAAVEDRLREWAQTGPEDYPGERRALDEAARVLEAWRAREAQAAEAQQQRLAARHRADPLSSRGRSLAIRQVCAPWRDGHPGWAMIRTEVTQ